MRDEKKPGEQGVEGRALCSDGTERRPGEKGGWGASEDEVEVGRGHAPSSFEATSKSLHCTYMKSVKKGVI